MSEKERMDRARRIRQMREGQREDDESSETTDEEATNGDEPATERSTTTEESTTGEETVTASDAGTTGATAESTASEASTDGGAAATHAEPDESTATDESAVETTDNPVDNVSGTTASVPSPEEMEAAMEQTMEQAESVEDQEADEEQEPAGPAAGIAGESTTEQTQEADTRILEFTLDDEQYCLDIQYIEEIVKHTNITRVPNTPQFVEGVVDLRGQITTILNPKVTIDKPNKEAGDLIVVFDANAFEDQGHIGWVVDDVRQVSPISDDQVNDPPMQEEYINGVIDREDGEFVIWTTPDLALEEAE